MAWASELVANDRRDEAVPVLARAKELFPDYFGPGNPYGLLADIYLERGDERAAIRELEALTTVNEYTYEEHVKLAELLAERDPASTRSQRAELLDRALYIYPLSVDVHHELADLYTELGEQNRVVRERRAIVGLQPANRSEALYDLAVALEASGDSRGARREVLRALELAPGYERAQRLLLELSGRGGS